MPLVPTRPTPLTPERAAVLINDAWSALAASKPEVPKPTGERLALLLALWDLETATGGQHRNHNFGNQVATRPDVQEFYAALDSGNPRKFRSYDSAEEGAASFVSQLNSDTRPQWREGLRTGNPTEFVRALKGLNGGPAYFELNFEDYLSRFLGRWERYDPKDFPPRRGSSTTPPTGQRGPSRVFPWLMLTGLGAFLFWSRGRSTRR